MGLLWQEDLILSSSSQHIHPLFKYLGIQCIIKIYVIILYLAYKGGAGKDGRRLGSLLETPRNPEAALNPQHEPERKRV